MSASPNSTKAVEPWQEELANRIKAFAADIGVDEQEVRSALSKLGINDSNPNSISILDDSDSLTVQDLFEAFVDTRLTQKATLRFASKHLRGKTYLNQEEPAAVGNDVAGAIRELASSNRPKSDWTDKELLTGYDEGSTEIAKILRERTHGRPCIILKSDGSVNVDESLNLVKLARKQTTYDRHQVGGQMVKVYVAGTFPAKALEESPFFLQTALVNGYCANSDTDWSDVDQETRILVRLYARNCETAALTKLAMREVCEDAKQGSASFRKKYREAAMMYDDLKEKDQLPKLKVMPNDVRQQASNGKSDTGF